jgi:hypothetical protein
VGVSSHRIHGVLLFFYVLTRPGLDTADNLVVTFILLVAGVLLRIASGIDG